MKNKFLHGAAALALCAGFVACSEYDAGVAPETLADIKSLQYETAFVQKFGKIDPEQDWGFGSGAETRSLGYNSWKSETRILASSIESEISTAFGLADIDNVNNVFDNHSDGSNVGASDVVIKNGEIYSYSQNRLESSIYVLSGGTLKITANMLGSDTKNGKIYVYQNASLIVEQESDFQIESGIEIYSKGTVTINGTLKICSGSVVYNEGTMSLKKDVYLSTGKLYNYSDLTIEGNIKAEGGTNNRIYNGAGNFIVKGQTALTSDDWWVNKGYYETGSMRDQVSTAHVYNYCQLIVKGELHWGDHQMYLMPDSYVHAGSAVSEGNQGWIEMWNGACLEVDKDMNLKSSKNKKIYTADDSFEACVCVGGETRTGYDENNKAFQLGGKITYAFEKLAGQNGGNDKPCFTAEYDNLEVPYTDLKNRIQRPSKTQCAATWKKTTNKTVKLERRVFCEDLGSIGDFDFNDVVFDVTIYDDKSVDITVLAAGGTLYIEVDGHSIHTELGMPYMVNTIVGGAKCDPVTIHTATTVNVNDENSLLQYIKDIKIQVYQSNPQDADDIERIELIAEKGKAPMKICVPKNTRWMKEYERIDTGYTKFTDWVNGKTNAPSLEDTFSESNANSNLLY